MTSYLVDTNFFIQAWRDLYPPDVLPSFWEKVSQLGHQNQLISIDKVKAELYRMEDDLKKWSVDHLPHTFFRDTSTAQQTYASVVQWAQSRSGHYKPTAIADFLDVDAADAWLVAYAAEHGLPIVTYEKSAPEARKRIKIPDVAREFNVRTLTTIEMLREIGTQL